MASTGAKVAIAIGIAIVIIVIIILIVFFATRTTATALSAPLVKIQRSTVTTGSDTLVVAGNVIYYATPTGGDVTLNIPATLNNPAGTIVQVKNESAVGGTSSRNIVIVPGTGVTISTGGFPQATYLTARPSELITLSAIGLNSYVRT